MGSYCSIVRSHNPSETINVVVIRADTLEVLEGQMNGRELEVTSVLGGGSGDGGSGDDGGSSASSGGSLGNPDAASSGEEFFSTEFNDVENWYTVTVPKTEDFRALTNNGFLFMEVEPSDS